MARTESDVQLVIRAKNEATSAINSVASALKALDEAQKAAATSSGSAGDLMGDLAKSIGTLKNQLSGLSALSQVATQMDKAADAISRLEASLAQSKNDMGAFETEMAKAAQSSASLADKQQELAAAETAARAAVLQARKERNAATAEVNRATAALQKYQAQEAAGKTGASTRVQTATTRLDTATTAQSSATSNFTNAQAVYDAAAQAAKENAQALAVVQAQESALEKQITKTASAITRQTGNIEKAKSEFAEIATVAQTASSSLGNVAVTQDAIAAAAEKATEQLNKLSAAQERLTTTSNTQSSSRRGASTTTAATSTSGASDADAAGVSKVMSSFRQLVSATQEAKEALAAARAEASALGKAMSQTDAPTQEMIQNFAAARATVRATKAEFESLGAQMSAFKGISIGAFANLTNESRLLNPALASLNSKAAQTANSLNRLGTSGGSEALSFMQRLRGEVLSLATSFVGLYGVINGLSSVISAIRTTDSSRSQLLAAYGGDAEQVQREFQFLRAESDRLGISFKTLSSDYGKFSIAANQANISGAASRQIFIALAEAGRSAHLSNEDVTGSFNALTQMISKGTVQAEELRGQLGDRLPGAFNIMAQALGVTTTQLGKMMAQGQVLADQDTLLKFAQQLQQAYSKGLPDALQSSTYQVDSFFSNLFKAQQQVSQGGFEEGLKNGLADLNKWFQSEDGVRFFTQLGAAAGRLAEIVLGLGQNVQYVLPIFEVWVGLKIAPAIASATQALLTFNSTVRTTATTAAAGPIGNAWTAAMTAMTASTNGAQAALVRFATAAGTSATAAGVARTAATAIGTAMTSLTGILAGVATGVRALWVAFGGWPAVIATGITLALGKWLTSVDSVNDAMTQHQRIMDDVSAAYVKAKGDAASFRQEASKGLLEQMESQFQSSLNAYQTALSRLQKQSVVTTQSSGKNSLSLWDRIRGSIGSSDTNADMKSIFPQTYTYTTADSKALKDLTDQYQAGTVSVDEYLKKLRELNQNSSDDAFKVLIRTLIENASAASTARDNLSKLVTAMVSAGSQSPQVNQLFKQLGGTFSDLGGAAENGKNSIQSYTDALQKLQDQLGKLQSSAPGAKQQLANVTTILNQGLRTPGITDAQRATLNSTADQLRSAINAQSDARTINSQYVDHVINAESGGRVGQNTSVVGGTAAGLAGFTEDTWLNLFRKAFPNATDTSNQQALSLRDDQNIVRIMVEELAKQNAATLRSGGNEATDTNLYLAHFLGGAGANTFLSGYNQNPSAPATNYVSQAAAASNQRVFFNQDGSAKTAQQVYQWAQRIMDVSQNELTASKAIVSQEQQRVTRAAAFHTQLQAQLETQQQQIAGGQESNRQATIMRATQQAINRARQDGTSLTKSELAQLQRQTGELYDQQHAQSQINQLRARYSDIQAQASLRSEMLQNANSYRQNGDAQSATELTNRANLMTPQIQASLNGLQNEIAASPQAGTLAYQTLNSQLERTRLSLNNVRDASERVRENIGESFASEATNALGSVAEAVANASVGFESWGQAIRNIGTAFAQFAAQFLLEIGEMIVKAQILSALGLTSSATSGAATGAETVTGVLSFFSKMFHEGGIVGQGGGMARSVSPMLFAGAPRFHTGGFPGLQANEVPAILKKNEEVLTADDPRNALNGGKNSATPATQGTAVRNIVVFDDKEVANAMSGSSGEAVTITHVKKNAATIRQILGVK